MNPVLEEIIKTRQVRPPDGGDPVPVHSAISAEEGSFLQETVRRADPKISLEVGLAYGISALYLCDALRIREGTRHIVVDPMQNAIGDSDVFGNAWKGIGIANLRRAGYGDIVHLIEKPSYRALAELEMAGQRIDFAFIDGFHTFDFALIDFFYVDRMLQVGGIVTFDDTNWPALQRVCRFIVTNRAYRVEGSCGQDGVPWKGSVARNFLKATPLARYCSQEILRPNAELGIKGSCIAFRKEADDIRLWNDFKDF